MPPFQQFWFEKCFDRWDAVTYMLLGVCIRLTISLFVVQNHFKKRSK